MHKIIILLVITGVGFGYGKAQQVLDEAYIKCSYAHTYLKDTVNNIQRDDLLILQVGEKLSKSYSYYSNQVDSFVTTSGYEKKFWTMFNDAVDKEGYSTSNFPHKRMKTYVYKNYPQGKITVTDGLSLQDYRYEDELNAQNWQMLDSIKTILDYPCQKAECDFRGRHWTAWFTSDIPISDGPWKFSGLPGLIMEVYDRGQQYHFTIIGLQKVENEPIVFSKTYVGSKKFGKTNRKDFLKAKKKYLMDMNGYIELETGIDLGGNTSQKVMQYDLIELDYK